MDALIAVEISPREARIWRFMMESGVFDMRGGNVVLSFDELGELKSLKKESFFRAVDNSFASKKRAIINS